MRLQKKAALLVCLSLICALLLACSGCNKETKAESPKSWDTSIDITDAFRDELKSLLDDEEALKLFDIGKVSFDVNLSVQEDGSYKLTVDESSLNRAVADLMKALKTGSEKYQEANKPPEVPTPPPAGANSLVGSWVTSYDVTSDLLASIRRSVGDEDMRYFSGLKFSFDVVLELRSSGTYKLAIDQDAMKRSLDRLIVDVEQALLRYIQDYVAANAPGMTVEEYLAENDMTLEEFYEQFEDQLSVFSGMSIENSGTYAVEGSTGTILLDGSTRLNYTLSGNTLTLFDSTQTMVFTRK